MNKVREIREGLGLSQVELARRAKVGANNLCAVERGRLAPWPKLMRKLARALKVPVAELFPDSAKGGEDGSK